MNADAIAISVIQTLVLPPLGLFLVYGAGLVLRLWQPRLGSMICGMAITILFLLCTNAGAWLFVHPLESLTAPLQSTKDSKAQAIVVLAAGRLESSPEYGGEDIPDYIALARLRYTAKLHRETMLPVLVSGGYGPLEGHVEPLTNGMVRALQDDFATPVKWVEDKSVNTAENSEFSAQILKQSAVHRILLVTDAMHMPRSKMVFSQEGLEVIAAPTMFFSKDKLTLADYLPSAEGLRRSRYAIHEWLGLAWYCVRYGTCAGSRYLSA
jgi:uncharacterized SAM-binding protein YcdF (DUF218 family)